MMSMEAHHPDCAEYGFGTGWLLWSRIKGRSIVLVWLATAIALAGAIYFSGEYAVLLWGTETDYYRAGIHNSKYSDPIG